MSRKRTHSPDSDYDDYQAGITLDLCTADFDAYNKRRKVPSDSDVGDMTSVDDVDMELTSDVKPTSQKVRFLAMKSEYLKRLRLEAGTSDALDYNREVRHCMTQVSGSLLDMGLNIGDWHSELVKVTEPTTGRTMITPQYCHVCQVKLSGQKPMDDHKKGKAHLKKVQQGLVALNAPADIPMDTSSNMGTSSNMDTSSNKDRSSNMDTSSVEPSSEVISTHDDHYKCLVCHMDISGRAQRLQHINGKKHKKKVADRDALANRCYATRRAVASDTVMVVANDGMEDSGELLLEAMSRPGNEEGHRRSSAMDTSSQSGTSQINDGFGDMNTRQSGTSQINDSSSAMMARSTPTPSSEIVRLQDEFYRCQLCVVDISGEKQRLEHLSGKKHQKKLKESLSLAVNAASEDRPTHYCETCNVYLNGEQPIRDHLSGAQHNRNLKRKAMDK